MQVAGEHARVTLLDWLRIECGRVGTKEGCAEGDCGACTVVLRRRTGDRIEHQAVNACILLVGQVDGAEVITIEDLARPGGQLHPLQEAMVRQHGSQCGFCTPGIIMSLFAQHQDHPRPLTYLGICDQLAGNLCRCTGYRPIIEAAREAALEPPTDPVVAGTVEDLAALDDHRDVFAGDGGGFFAAPQSEGSLVALLSRYPDALIVSGMTDVGLTITKGLAQPQQVIWLGRVAGLDLIEDTPDGLVIGATATLAAAAAHLAALSPDLGEVVRRFGSVQVRNAATVGGNLANGSPIGDLAPCLIALNARLELSGPDGTRSIPLERFFIAYRQQDRRTAEYLRRIIIPRPEQDLRFRAYKVSKRMDEDISAVLSAFALRLEGEQIAEARLAYGGMAGIPSRAPMTEAKLAGLCLSDPAAWEPALAQVHDEFAPLTDHRASARYRRLVARHLLEKALHEIAGAAQSTTRIGPYSEARDGGR